MVSFRREGSDMRKKYYVKRRRYRRKARARFYIIIAFIIVALGVGTFFIVKSLSNREGSTQQPSDQTAMTPPAQEDIDEISQTPTQTPEDVDTSLGQDIGGSQLAASLTPAFTDETDPANFGFETALMYNNEDVESWKSDTDITFGTGDEYTVLEGITTFRGNNYRDAPSYGYADLTAGSETLTKVNMKTGGMVGTWGGSGWTGQPIIVKWPADLRSKMTSLFEDFRDKEDFTEVIIPSLDGNMYFMELTTGEKTRNPIFTGGPTKGTASLDPRGYPIIYVGQGLSPEGSPNNAYNDIYFRAFSLIDGDLIMKVGAATRDPFANRTDWQAYDSSPLIDAESDTLIWPGENGVIYLCKLNTQYNEETGEVSMDEEPVKAKYKYTSTRNTEAKRWGIEDSIVTWRNYMIFTDNAGMLQCVDLNTLELVYANDLSDDSDVSMVLEEAPSASTFYLYTGCEYDELVRDLGNTGTAYARKLDGLTGEIIWETPFTVFADDNVDGGILASPVLGKAGTTMEGLIIYNVSYEVSGSSSTSRLVALNKFDGSLVWEYDMEVSGWSPSSPVPVYTQDGQGYIVQCDRDGDIVLLRVDVESAVEAAKLNVEDNFEATPAVFDNMIVVGSRKSHFFFIKME